MLRDYAAFADPQLGRWQRRADGSLSPNARSMTMPLLQLFHGEPGGKQWKNAVDASLRTATSVAQVRTPECCRRCSGCASQSSRHMFSQQSVAQPMLFKPTLVAHTCSTIVQDRTDVSMEWDASMYIFVGA